MVVMKYVIIFSESYSNDFINSVRERKTMHYKKQGDLSDQSESRHHHRLSAAASLERVHEEQRCAVRGGPTVGADNGQGGNDGLQGGERVWIVA